MSSRLLFEVRGGLRQENYKYSATPAGDPYLKLIMVTEQASVNGAPADKWVGLLTTACGTVAESGAACVAAGTSLSWKNAGAATQRVFLFMDLASRSPAEADYNVIPTLN